MSLIYEYLQLYLLILLIMDFFIIFLSGKKNVPQTPFSRIFFCFFCYKMKKDFCISFWLSFWLSFSFWLSLYLSRTVSPCLSQSLFVSPFSKSFTSTAVDVTCTSKSIIIRTKIEIGLLTPEEYQYSNPCIANWQIQQKKNIDQIYLAD